MGPNCRETDLLLQKVALSQISNTEDNVKIRQLVHLCDWYMQYVFALITLQMGQPSTSPVQVDTWSALADRHSY